VRRRRADPAACELARRLKVALREIQYGIDEMQAAQASLPRAITIGISRIRMRISCRPRSTSFSPSTRTHRSVLGGRYEALLDDLRGGGLDFLFGVLRRRTGRATSTKSFCSPIPMRWWCGAGIRFASAQDQARDLAAHDWILPARGAPRRERSNAFSPAPPMRRKSASRPPRRRSTGPFGHQRRITLLSRLEAQFDDSAGR